MAKAIVTTKPKIRRRERRPAAIDPAAWLDSWELAKKTINQAKGG